jgi:hypothetical protein
VYRGVEESNHYQLPLHLIFIRELQVIAEKDLKRTEADDPVAKRVFTYAQEHCNPQLIYCYYVVSDSFPDIAAAYALRFEASSLLLDPPRLKLFMLIKRNDAEALRKLLPKEIEVIQVEKYTKI